MRWELNPRRRGDVILPVLREFDDQGGAKGEGADESGSTKQKCGKVTPYPEVVTFQLRTYAADDVITDADPGIKQFRQFSPFSPSKYAQELCMKEFKCRKVYTEDRMKGIDIEWLQESSTTAIPTFSSRPVMRNIWRVLETEPVPLPIVRKNRNSTAVVDEELC